MSEKGNTFLNPLKKKGFKEESVTTMRLDALGPSTPLESNKSVLQVETSEPNRAITSFTLVGRSCDFTL